MRGFFGIWWDYQPATQTSGRSRLSFPVAWARQSSGVLQFAGSLAMSCTPATIRMRWAIQIGWPLATVGLDGAHWFVGFDCGVSGCLIGEHVQCVTAVTATAIFVCNGSFNGDKFLHAFAELNFV